MYVSIRDDTLLATGFEDIAEGLRFYGLAGVELAMDRECRVRPLTSAGTPDRLALDGDGWKELARQRDETGLRVAAFCLANDFNRPDREAELAWVVRVVEIAAALGVPAVRIDAIMHGERDLPPQEREEIFAASVRHIVDRTEGLSVDLGIENHGFQGNDPAFLDGLLARVGSPRLGLTMDTGNFYWAGHPLERVYDILRHFAPVAKHTHLKNIQYPQDIRETQREMGYEYGRYVCPIPEGDIDHARVVRDLQAAGYDRDLCIEDESLGKFDLPTRRAHIQATADYLSSLI